MAKRKAKRKSTSRASRRDVAVAKLQAVVDDLREAGARLTERDPEPYWPRIKTLTAEAAGQFEEAKSVLEDLQSEMESWRDSIPENLQGGNKCQEVEEAYDNLSSAVESVTSEFPFEADQAFPSPEECREFANALEELATEVEEAIGYADDTQFPAMFG